MSCCLYLRYTRLLVLLYVMFCWDSRCLILVISLHVRGIYFFLLHSLIPCLVFLKFSFLHVHILFLFFPLYNFRFCTVQRQQWEFLLWCLLACCIGSVHWRTWIWATGAHIFFVVVCSYSVVYFSIDELYMWCICFFLIDMGPVSANYLLST